MTQVEPIHIETFCEKLKPRVAVRTGVEVAYEKEPRRSSWPLVCIAIAIVIIAVRGLGL